MYFGWLGDVCVPPRVKTHHCSFFEVVNAKLLQGLIVLVRQGHLPFPDIIKLWHWCGLAHTGNHGGRHCKAQRNGINAAHCKREWLDSHVYHAMDNVFSYGIAAWHLSYSFSMLILKFVKTDKWNVRPYLASIKSLLFIYWRGGILRTSHYHINIYPYWFGINLHKLISRPF